MRKILPAFLPVALLAACGGGDDSAVSSDPAPTPAPVAAAPVPPAQAAPPSVQPSNPIIPSPAAPSPPAGLPAPPATTPPTAGGPPSAPVETPAPPSTQPTPAPTPAAPAPTAVRSTLFCDVYGIGWARDFVGPGEPVQPVGRMYPVEFLVDYAGQAINVVRYGIPPDRGDYGGFLTAPIAEVSTLPDGGASWRVADPRPWVGDSTFGFRDGQLVSALQAAGQASYTYVDCEPPTTRVYQLACTFSNQRTGSMVVAIDEAAFPWRAIRVQASGDAQRYLTWDAEGARQRAGQVATSGNAANGSARLGSTVAAGDYDFREGASTVYDFRDGRLVGVRLDWAGRPDPPATADCR